VFAPILPGRSHRPEDEPVRDKRRQELSRGYEETPWLTLLVNFSGFLVVVPGSIVLLFVLGVGLTGGRWVPYALLLGAVVGTHVCLRAIRYRRRHRWSSRSHTGERVTS
jgi:hypothetical protein